MRLVHCVLATGTTRTRIRTKIKIRIRISGRIAFRLYRNARRKQRRDRLANEGLDVKGSRLGLVASGD
eukprot:7959332-Prorocentrum_lima.AAC.1